MVDLQASKLSTDRLVPSLTRPFAFVFAGSSIRVQHVLRHDPVSVRREGSHCDNAGREILRHQSARRVHVQGRD